MMKRFLTLLALLPSTISRSQTLFELMYPDHTNIGFANDLVEDTLFNVIQFEYFYHGGGVAIGDINNDNLPDVYLTGNMTRDRLYLNLGDMKFRDITDQAGIDLEPGWKYGVTMADVNGDGWLDIYVCRAGNFPPEMRANRLYINNGNLTFTDKAREMGVADDGHSFHAAFLDYDHDGDLDMYLINTPLPIAPEIRIPFWEPHVPQRCDVLYKNNGAGKFTDATMEAGLPVVEYGYGLSMAVGDLNRDGWDDIYVANDYAGPDYMYINNRNGTLTNQLPLMIGHTSNNAMGSAIADINNDAWPDIAVVDMVAPDYKRSKRMMATMNVKNFWYIHDNGGHFQYMRNTLQLNNHNGSFSEIGQFAGISQTDWSWAVLPADLDNDGWKDMYVTNGILRDITDRDFEVHQLALMGQLPDGSKPPLNQFLNLLESTELSDYAFRNNRDLTFTDVAKTWGVDLPGFANGIAYGDLDADGDLDLVINNVNFPARIYRNNGGGGFLRVRLQGEGMNKLAVGARVELFSGDQVQYNEQHPVIGYLSSSEPVVHFGLGTMPAVDSLRVIWPDGRVSLVKAPTRNTVITISQSEAQARLIATPQSAKPFEDVSNNNILFQHRENAFDDFEKEVLLPHKMSQLGPALAVGDVNGDKLEDFYVGGASGQPGALKIQNSLGEFVNQEGPWEAARGFEDVAATFFDADNDGDLDLYVASGGGGDVPEGSPLLQDRLYRNDGSGMFQRDPAALPEMLTSSGCVAAADFNGDGWTDLFVGGRVRPGMYPHPPHSYLLMNKQGAFSDVTSTWCSDLVEPGMVSDAVWADITGDGKLDLIICGEWMGVRIFVNSGSGLSEKKDAGTSDHSGWWWTVKVVDIDSDGDLDILAGNMGHNMKFHASPQKPFHVFSMDFDGNGTNDIVLSKYYNNKLVPVRGKECSTMQMPFISQKFPTYRSFSEAYMEDIYTSEKLEQALHLQATEFGSGVFVNDGSGHFTFEEWPNEAQLFPVMGIELDDVNGDGLKDVILAGNFWVAEVETIRYDAGTGLILLSKGNGEFEVMPSYESGFYAARDVRNTAVIRTADGSKLVLVANNNDYLQVFRLTPVDGR